MAKLLYPIKRGETEISEVTLRKPNTGALRGLKMLEIMRMDVNSMLMLLPRISEPALLPAEAADLDPADLMRLSNEVVSFFMNPADLREAEETATLN